MTTDTQPPTDLSNLDARKTTRPVVMRPPGELHPDENSPRKYNRAQYRVTKALIHQMGVFTLVVTDNNRVVCGELVVEAAKQLGLSEIPTMNVAELSQAEIAALQIAHDKIPEMGSWDRKRLGETFKLLTDLNLGWSPEITGFVPQEIDVLIDELTLSEPGADPADKVAGPTAGPVVSQKGDLWKLGDHRVFCGDARDPVSYETLMAAERAAMIITDFPYNVKIRGNVGGLGDIQHPEFAMASGEMNREEFTKFLREVMELMARFSVDGALHFGFMDWRHMREILDAGYAVYTELKNLCVWVKRNGGMGSLYRSRQELVFVFKHGTASHQNNVELGKHGRNRTNVWEYAGMNDFGRSGEEGNLLELHPTVKPVKLVADAILDASQRGEIILDPFLGSGTTVIAADRVGRICYGIEYEPSYVDVAIRRWQAMTGGEAIHAATGRTFNDIAREKEAGNV